MPINPLTRPSSATDQFEAKKILRKSEKSAQHLRRFLPFFFGKLNLQFLGQRLLTIRTSSGPNQLQDAERPTDTMSAEPGKLPG